jgi:hypothetical protein
MRQILKFLVIGIVMTAFSATTFAQVSATATATATIVSPIAIAKTVDMNFGNVAASAALGTVVLAPGGGRSITGGVTLPATTGTVTAASFTVTGTPGYTYAITLPAVALTITSGGPSMTVDTWTSNPSPTGTLTAGTSTLTVGATLHVGANQAAGVYGVPAETFTVTVNYN